MGRTGTVLLQGIVPWGQINTTQHRMAHAFVASGRRCVYLEPRSGLSGGRRIEPRAGDVPLVRERWPWLPSRALARVPLAWALEPVLHQGWDRPLWFYRTSGRVRHMAVGDALQGLLRPEWTTLEIWDLPEAEGRDALTGAVRRVDAAWTVDRAMDTTGAGLPEIPNAADRWNIAPSPGQGRPVAGFCGSINAWLDLDGLMAVARAGDCDLEIIGAPFALSPDARRRWRQLLAEPRVHWLGPLPYREAARRMAGWSVGLLPRNGTAGAQESCPLKVLEYLAAGVPCVGTHRGAARRYPDVCVCVEGAQAFADACRNAPDMRRRLAGRCREHAAAWTWDRRLEAIQSLTEGAATDGRRAARIPGGAPGPGVG